MQKIFFTISVLILGLFSFISQTSADSSSNYIFEDGGIDVSGGFLESDLYLLEHTLNYDFSDETASSQNYQEITEHTALQVFCGNKIVEPSEECDDGNFINGDGCSDLCKIEGSICGNGVLEIAEECDDGNLENADGCSNLCKNEEIISNNEGQSWGSFFWAVCGNGVIEQNEQCDDGNRISSDGCSKTCMLEKKKKADTEELLHFSADGLQFVCGNGILDLTEECDDGNLNDDDSCNSNCEVNLENDFIEKKTEENKKKIEKNTNQEFVEMETLFAIAECGNGLLEEGERCDDWNTDDNDGCSYRCRIEPSLTLWEISEKSWKEQDWFDKEKNTSLNTNDNWEKENNDVLRWSLFELESEEEKKNEELHWVTSQVQRWINTGELTFIFVSFFFFFSDIDFRFQRKKKLFKIFKINQR